MKTFLERLPLSTKGFPDIIDITGPVGRILSRTGLSEGLLTVFVPGSTAGITTIEYEPGLLKDLPALCTRLAPREARYHHDDTWHDGNGYAHLLAALFKPSLSIPVSGGILTLGTWQQIVFADFDTHPRQREVIIQIIGETS